MSDDRLTQLEDRVAKLEHSQKLDAFEQQVSDDLKAGKFKIPPPTMEGVMMKTRLISARQNGIRDAKAVVDKHAKNCGACGCDSSQIAEEIGELIGGVTVEGVDAGRASVSKTARVQSDSAYPRQYVVALEDLATAINDYDREMHAVGGSCGSKYRDALAKVQKLRAKL